MQENADPIYNPDTFDGFQTRDTAAHPSPTILAFAPLWAALSSQIFNAMVDTL